MTVELNEYKELKLEDLNITLQHMENALNVLLTAYVSQRRNPVGTVDIYGPGFMALSQIPMGKQGELLDLCEDPIRHALREAIVSMGNHIYEHLGSTNKMLDLAERVADMDEANYGYRVDVLDKCFDGIGDWVA